MIAKVDSLILTHGYLIGGRPRSVSLEGGHNIYVIWVYERKPGWL